MRADFVLRIATPEDELPVSELLKASYSVLMAPTYDAALLGAALPMMARANPALLSSGTYYLAETAGGLIVGCGGWTREGPATKNVTPGLGHIRHFATHPEWIGRDIGRSLYVMCEEVARSFEVQRFECYASLNAEKFYAALGFKSICQLEIPLGRGLNFPSVLMEKSI